MLHRQKKLPAYSTINNLDVRKVICVVFILTPIGKGGNLFTECVDGCKDFVAIRWLIYCITESVLYYVVCMETASWNWMSDVDSAHQTVNVFKIADDGFKEVQKKDMVEAATPQNSMMTDGLRKYLAFFCIGFLEVLSDIKMNCVVKKVRLFFPGLLQKKNNCVLNNSCQ